MSILVLSAVGAEREKIMLWTGAERTV